MRSASALQSSNLLSHSMLPLLVDSSLPKGRVLNQSNSGEAKTIGRMNGATIIKRKSWRRLWVGLGKDGEELDGATGHAQRV